MEYVIGLFADRHQAGESLEPLKAVAVPGDEYAVKDHETTVKGWLERLFDMQEPQATMEAHGLQRETSEWLDTQIESGRVMVAVRTNDPAVVSRALSVAGASDIRRIAWAPGEEPSIT
jgi:hypothetical protein